VVSSGRLQRPASITLQVTQIANTPVEMQPELIDGKSHAGRNVGLIGGGAAAGAILGAVAGGGRGAAIGSLIGAGAGVATAAATGKKEIVLQPETMLGFETPGGAPPAPPEPPRAAVAVAPAAPPPPPPQPQYSEPEPGYRAASDRDYRDDDRGPEYRDRDRDGARMRIFFTDRERDMIRDYFTSFENRRELSPAARRDGELPPGLEKQLHRDGFLNPGMQRRAEGFPERLERRMEPLPRRFSRVILAGRAMIVREDGQIMDMVFIY
jgi:hypothetical protein